MKNAFEELGIASLGLFLSLGLSLNVYAQTEVVKVEKDTGATAVTQPAPTQEPQPIAQPAPPPPSDTGKLHMSEPGPTDNRGQGPGDQGGMYGPPPISQRELQDFKRQFTNDIPSQARQVLKDMGSMSGGEASDWKTTLNRVLSDAKQCVADIAKAAADDRRDVMNDCQGKNLFQEIQDIRDRFIPERELKNEYRQMQDQERELNRFLTQLIGSPNSEKRKRALSSPEGQNPLVKQLNEMLSSVGTHRSAIKNASGTDQRSAVDEYRNSSQGIWEEINKLRAVIEIPKQLKDIKTQLKYVTAQVQPAVRKDGSTGPIPFEKAATFFGIDLSSVQSAVKEKADTIAEIETAIETGDADTAQSLMQESIYNGWHPGDLRGLLDMTKGAYQQTKAIRDNDLREQIIAIIDPIVETMGGGDYRAAREGMEQVTREMQRFEQYFNGPQRPQYSAKMDKAFDQLEGLMRKKFEKYIQDDGPQEGGDNRSED